MIERTEPRDTSSPLHFTVNVEGHGSFVFRRPRLSVAADLVTNAPTGVLSRVNKAQTPMETLQALGEAFDPMCAVVGACWAHPTLDLETPSGGDFAAFGAGVAEEFHESGYSLELVSALFSAVLENLTSVFTANKKAQQRATDFPKEDGTPSRP